jgi:hypothetical protein
VKLNDDGVDGVGGVDRKEEKNVTGKQKNDCTNHWRFRIFHF